jgi:hypothetical protein
MLTQEMLPEKTFTYNKEKYTVIQGFLGIGDMSDELNPIFNSNGIYRSFVINNEKRGETPLKDLFNNVNIEQDTVLAEFKSTNVQEISNWIDFVNKTYN